MRWVFHYLRTSEGVILLTTLFLSAAVGLMNPVFLTAANLLDLVRNSITTGLFALGVLIALLSGGIDVSFTAIAAVAMYGTVKLFVQVKPQAPLILILLVGAAIGSLLGMVNGILIAFFRLPTLIVTLGTLGFFRGFLLTFLGTRHIVDLPGSMIDLSRTYLYRGRLADGSLFSLPATTLVLVGVTILVAVMLRYTALGRFIYALGGSHVASSRLGIPVARTKLFIYVLIGLVAGITGIVHTRDVIRDQDRFNMNPVRINRLRSGIEIQHIAGIIAVKVQDALARVDSAGRGRNLVHAWTAKYIPDRNATCQSPTHVTEKDRQVPAPPSCDNSDSISDRRICSHERAIIRTTNRLEPVGMRKQEPL